MDLLRDEEIYNLCIVQENPIIEGIPHRDKERLNPEYWYRSESPIQASSVDLHIGNIYIPNGKENEQRDESDPVTGHKLSSGETAIVITQERFNLPKNIAGIGFPPSRKLSFRGILMTNPGHIDPGYKGPLHFTLINMGKEQFDLKHGDIIVSVLLFRLSLDAHKDWLERHRGEEAAPSTQKYLDSLSSDFMDFQNRTKEIVKQEIKESELTIKRWGILAPVIGIMITALITAYFSFVGGPIARMEKEITELRASIETIQLKARIQGLDARLQQLERQIPPKNK